MRLCICAGVMTLAFATGGWGAAQTAAKPRLVVLTDIGGDPDDQQSMVRLLAYANEFDVEALVATSRMGHGHDVRPDLIQQIVNAYGQVRANLLLHKPGYPTASALLGDRDVSRARPRARRGLSAREAVRREADRTSSAPGTRCIGGAMSKAKKRKPSKTSSSKTPRDGAEMAPCVLAGPTCDSADVLYEKEPYPLPVSIEIGDKLLIEGTGAYTSTYSAVAFNGFPPLKTYHI